MKDEMPLEAEELMDEVVDEMTERIETKFPKGYKKYGTILHKDHTVAFLDEMAMDELTDLPTYMIAMKLRRQEAVELLEDAIKTKKWNKVKKALEILR